MAEELVVTRETEEEPTVQKVVVSPYVRILVAAGAMLLVAAVTTLIGFFLFKSR